MLSSCMAFLLMNADEILNSPTAVPAFSFGTFAGVVILIAFKVIEIVSKNLHELMTSGAEENDK